MIADDPYGEIQMLVAGLPQSARTIVAKSKELRAADEIDLAFTLLERAVGKCPLAVVLAEQADLLAAEDQLDEALDVALQSVEADPTNVRARDVLARVLVEGLPQSIEHLVQISVLFAEEDEPDWAEDLLRTAVEQQPENVVLRERLAQFYADEGRTAGCIVELQALLRIDPRYTHAQVMLADSLLEQGDLPGARRWIEKARAQGADSALADEVEQKISELRGMISKSKNR